MDERKENLIKALSEIGIHTEAELNAAIRALPPLNLYIFTSQAEQAERAGNG